MIDFNIEIRDKRDGEWYIVTDVGFRFHKNHPSDGINYIKILKDGIEEIEPIYIAEIRFNQW